MGINIASRLENAASEWNITDERIVAVVSDNASNMRVAAEEVGYGNTSAALAILYTCSALASNIHARLTAAACKLVGHFKHSTIAMSALKQKQKQTNIAEHHLIQDITTRCNSTYYMALKSKDGLYTRYYLMKPSPLLVTNTFISGITMDHVRASGQDPKTTTSRNHSLCEAKIVTISLIYLVINGLLKKHLVINDDDVPQTVMTEIERQFD